jgi:hypothetical protein
METALVKSDNKKAAVMHNSGFYQVLIIVLEIIFDSKLSLPTTVDWIQ